MTTAHGKHRDRRWLSRARGFTLLEVLLAAILSAVLLAVLWGVFSVYLRLFETGPAQTEQVQLARTLLQQLSDDLQSAIEDGPGEDPQATWPGPASGSGSVRRFGLLGTAHALRMDVLQVMPLEEAPSLSGDVADTLRGVTVRQVPELRTIFYTFQPRDFFANADQIAAEQTDPEAKPGLTRRELDYETPYADAQDALAGRRLPGATTSRARNSTSEISTDPLSDELLDAELQDDSTTWVPEVVGLEFRYFDGNGFRSDWDSLQQQSLPAAVEVTMQFSSLDELAVKRSAADGLEREEEQREEEMEFENELDRLEEGRLSNQEPPAAIYRLWIDLPSAKKHPGIKRPARRRAAIPEPIRTMPPAPLAVPGPLTIKPAGGVSTSPQKTDQWMRTGL